MSKDIKIPLNFSLISNGFTNEVRYSLMDWAPLSLKLVATGLNLLHSILKLYSCDVVSMCMPLELAQIMSTSVLS